MSMQNKRTLFVVFILVMFTLTAFLFTQTSRDSNVSLRDYIDLRVDDLQAQINRRTDEMKHESEIALTSLNARLAGMNEFRQAINDASKLYATKEMVDKLESEIKTLRSLSDIAQGKASQTSLLVVGMVSFFGLAIQISRLYLERKKI